MKSSGSAIDGPQRTSGILSNSNPGEESIFCAFPSQKVSEINRLESEKVGRDVGFDLAFIDWKLKHYFSVANRATGATAAFALSGIGAQPLLMEALRP
jgi:hypothetical protein